ncbi:MAG: choice-of-anchor M domain-containing protein [Armatimonas sp.]
MKVLLTLALTSLFLGSAYAQTTLSQGHADIGIDYTLAEGWNLHVHDEENDLEFAPDEAIFAVKPEAITTRPAGSAFDFIGVGAGESYYRLPQAQNPDLLFLGFGAEELDPDGLFEEWDPDGGGPLATGKWLRVDLISTQHTLFDGNAGTGQFSVWASGDTGPEVNFATMDGIDASDQLFLLAGGHEHRNFGFTQSGTYDVTFSVSGQLASTHALDTSPTATYRFLVAAAPEPGALSLSLLALPGVGLAFRRRQS